MRIYFGKRKDRVEIIILYIEIRQYLLRGSYADIASAQNANNVKIPFVDNDSGFGEPKRLATRWRRTAL